MNIDRNPGEDVVISKAETPLAQIISDHIQKTPRSPGIWKGQVMMAKDFDDPLPPEILDYFLGVEE
jgi:antitoxin (DNA-binding transcriptional repressor) of toxin-antitoxin stability system